MAAAAVMMAGSRNKSNSGAADKEAHKLIVALQAVFNDIDNDSSGSLEKKEIGELFEASNCPLSAGQLDEVMAEVDDDGGGDVDFDEFAGWMMGPSKYAANLRHNLHSNVLGGAAFDTLIDDEEVAMAAREKDKNERWVWQDPDGDIRCTVFIFLEEANTSKGAFWWSMFMQLLIFISSVIFVVETLENVKTNVEAKKDMAIIEWACVIAFTVEYLVRLAVCTARPYKDSGFCSYFSATMNLVDFFAIAPAYFEQGMVLITGKPLGGNFAVLRILRLARIFRVVKVGTFKENLDLVVEALRRSRSGLLLMVYLVVIFMVIMSSIMYMAEEGTEGTSFVDIPHTFWCTIVTMTSVGYGDMYPITDASRAIGSVIMLSGILTLAVPITLISNNFQDVWVAAKQEKKKKAMMADLRNNIGGGEEAEEAEKVAAVSEIQLQTWLVTANVLLEKSYDYTNDERFRAAAAVLNADGNDFNLQQSQNLVFNGDDWTVVSDDNPKHARVKSTAEFTNVSPSVSLRADESNGTSNGNGNAEPSDDDAAGDQNADT